MWHEKLSEVRMMKKAKEKSDQNVSWSSQHPIPWVWREAPTNTTPWATINAMTMAPLPQKRSKSEASHSHGVSFGALV